MPAKPRPNIFADDDDEISNISIRKGVDVGSVNTELSSLHKKRDRVLEQITAEAVAEDPSVYEYDEVYEKIHADRDEANQRRALAFDSSAGNLKKESRYIGGLMKNAEIRKVKDDRVFQMKLKKEADKDYAIYGDKEKFVTETYKEQLKEMGRWKEEDKRLAEFESANSGENKKNMTGFYSNLLTKNLSMGAGDVSKGTSAYTIGSKRNDHLVEVAARQKREFEQKTETDVAHDDEVDEDELLRRTEHGEVKRQRLDDEAVAENESGETVRLMMNGEVRRSAPSIPKEPAQTVDIEQQQREEKEEKEKREAEHQKTRELASQSARERYLARKNAKSGN